jgi:hypothetical protein
MNQTLIRRGMIFSLFFYAYLLWGCSAPTQPAQTPLVVTVVNTVPVEVTRMVPVEQTVEVTREVLVTQLVQIPVTDTPGAIPSLTPTPPPPTPTYLTAPTKTIVWIPTRPPVKVNGVSYFKITNNTNIKADVIFDGPVTRNFIVGGGTSLLTSLPWGSYTYRVLQDGKVTFSGDTRLVNSDKYEMVIDEDRVIIKGP